jgi:glycosyltransferase involved in cell wall biosynthesis
MAALGTVLIVTNIPTPYRIPLFNEVSRQLEARGGRLVVAFGATGYRGRKWRIDLADCRFEFRVLGSRALFVGGAESASFTYAGLGRVLRDLAPSAVIVTGYSLATVQLWWRRAFERRPYLIWSGSIATGGETGQPWRAWQRRLLVRRAAAFVAYGTLARDYLVSLGAPPDRIRIAINTVDTEFFRSESMRLRRLPNGNEDPAGAPARFLYIGELSARKNVRLLLEAVALLASRRRDFSLDVVGDGPERAALESWARDRGLAGQVQFHGYRQKAELPGYLAASRALLFQTGFDIWGLVLPEAMAAGVVPLSSVRAGATRDLVADGVTGFVLDFADTAAVAERLDWLLDHPAEAQRMGEAAAEFIRERASLAVAARGMLDAVEVALTG